MRQAPSPLLRRTFDARRGAGVGAAVRDRARAPPRSGSTARRCREDLLAPGWTAYRHRLLADTYDVTALLRPGENVIARRDRRRLVSRPARLQAAGRPRARTAREVGADRPARGRGSPTARRTVVATDGGWQASTGEIRSADLYDGCVDRPPRAPGRAGTRPGFDAAGWRPARASSTSSRRVIEPRIAPPVRVVGRPAGDADVARTAAVTQLDGGQNIAGYVRLARPRVAPATASRSGTPRCSSPTGRSTSGRCGAPEATDTYVLADDAVIDARAGVHVPRVPLRRGRDRRGAPRRRDRRDQQRHPARGRRSSAPTRGSTGCTRTSSWSQRDNFVSVPTDCPQRDERLGWTGDAQAFAPTGSHAVRRRGVLAKLAARPRARAGRRCSACRASCRTWCSTAPLRFGRAGWADAATIVPWAVYEAYGDPERPRGPVRQHARLGRVAGRRGAATTGCWSRRDAVRRLAGPRRAGGSAVGGQGRLRAPRQRVLRRTARGSLADAARLLGDDGVGGSRTMRSRDGGRGADVGSAGASTRITTQTGCAARASASGSRRPSERAACRDGAGGASSARRDGRRRDGLPGDAARAARARPTTGHLDEAYLMLLRRDAAVVAVPGRPGRDDRLGALGRDPARRLDPSGDHDAAAERRRRGPGRRTCCRSTTTPTAR